MKRTRLSMQHLAVAICLAIIAFPAWAQPSHANRAIVPGRLLVKFHDDVTPEKIQEILRSFGARSERQIPGIGVHVVALPSGATELTFEATFKQLPEVEFAEVDRYLQPQSITPNDYYY